MLLAVAMVAVSVAPAQCELRDNSMLLPQPKRPPCVMFGPARRATGIWIDAFEGSSFRENEDNVSALTPSEENVWLWINRQARPDLIRQEGSGHAYRIIFDGREAQDMHRKRGDGYGHFNMSAGLVVVDHIIMIDDLGCIVRFNGREGCTDLPVHP